MIPDLLIAGMYYVGSVIMDHLPTWSIPVTVIDPAKEILATTMAWNYATGGVLLAMLIVMGLILLFETVIIAFNLITGFLSLIRGGGSIKL